MAPSQGGACGPYQSKHCCTCFPSSGVGVGGCRWWVSQPLPHPTPFSSESHMARGRSTTRNVPAKKRHNGSQQTFLARTFPAGLQAYPRSILSSPGFRPTHPALLGSPESPLLHHVTAIALSPHPSDFPPCGPGYVPRDLGCPGLNECGAPSPEGLRIGGGEGGFEDCHDCQWYVRCIWPDRVEPLFPLREVGYTNRGGQP